MKGTHKIRFEVGVCLGRGDSGFVEVDTTISAEEYAVLVECCKNETELEKCSFLDSLRARVIEAAAKEAASYDPDSGLDYRTDAWYIVQMPDEVQELVRKG